MGEAAEPGKGYAEKAAEWRAKLDELQGTKAQSHEATEETDKSTEPRSDQGAGDQEESTNEGDK